MRTSLLVLIASLVTALPLGAQEAATEPPSLLSPNVGLMFWTLVIFLVVLFVLTKYAFKPITAAVEKREKFLEDAIAAAKADREQAAKLLEEHRKLLEGGHAEAQRFIVEARAEAEKVRTSIVEQAHHEQQQILERARGEIQSERDRAVAELRREAVELAVRGASKVVERNLDDAANRRLVESYLASLPAAESRR